MLIGADRETLKRDLRRWIGCRLNAQPMDAPSQPLPNESAIALWLYREDPNESDFHFPDATKDWRRFDLVWHTFLDEYGAQQDYADSWYWYEYNGVRFVCVSNLRRRIREQWFLINEPRQELAIRWWLNGELIPV